jgi:hypothetical protein
MFLCLLYDVDKFALIWVFLTIFGSRNVMQLRNGLTIWEISSVLPCARDGWLTLSRPMLSRSTLIITMVEFDRVIWSFPTKSDGCEVLGLLAWFSHQIPIQIAVLCFQIIAIIVQIMTIIGNNETNRA